MKKERKYFWCSGDLCGSKLGGYPIGYEKHPIDDLAEELKGRSLCKTCYSQGLRLRMAPEVYHIKLSQSELK